jgi:hypothetical protein
VKSGKNCAVFSTTLQLCLLEKYISKLKETPFSALSKITAIYCENHINTQRGKPKVFWTLNQAVHTVSTGL